MVSEARDKATHGNVINILPSKQMFQRLLIAPAHLKAGNISDLVNKMRQYVYLLH